jgi:translation initiation factor 3 subunit I
MFSTNTLNVKQFRGQGFMTVVKYSPEGDYLFIADKDSKYVSLVSTSNNQLVGTFNGHNGVVWHLDISNDSKYMISCSGDMSCIVWDIRTGEILNRISETGIPKYVSIKDNLVIIACDPISKRSKSYIGVYNLEDLVSGETNQLYKLAETETCRATTVTCISEDTILVSYDNGFVKKVNFKTQNIELEKSVHSESIKSVCMSNDKTNFLTGSLDTTAKIINLDTFEEISVFKSNVPINTAIYTPDNKFILLGGGIEAMMVAKTSDNDLTTKIYQVSNQKLFKQITNHFGPLRYLDFNPNGLNFATASQDGSAKIHYFNPIVDKTEVDKRELFGYALSKDDSELLLANEIISLEDNNVTDKIQQNKGNKKKIQEPQSYPLGHPLYKIEKEVLEYTITPKSNKSYESKQVSAVRVTNLPDDTYVKDLQDIFEFYGRIDNNGIRIIKLYNDTIAFVNYLNHESAKKAIEKCNKMKIGHSIIGVDMAKYN